MTAIIIAMCSLIGLWCCKQARRVFIADTFIIPTRSMTPTLIPGDKIIVNKLLYGARIYHDFNFSKQGVRLQCMRLKGLRDIQRGDVVVFNMPYHKGCDTIKFVINYVYCKRCVAIPGDSISIIGGYYCNNNTTETLGCVARQRLLAHTPDSIIPADALPTIPYDRHMPRWTIRNFGPMYIPRRGDMIAVTPATATLYRKLIEWETGKRVNIDWQHHSVTIGSRQLKRYTFSHDYYFMAGDNAPDSRDSRYIGLIPDDYIIGIATAICYSRDRNDGKMRWNRIFKAIN